MYVFAHLPMQIKVPELQARCYHSVAAFNISPGLAEVTVFGGCPEWPDNLEAYADLSHMASTTVLQFREFIM